MIIQSGVHTFRRFAPLAAAVTCALLAAPAAARSAQTYGPPAPQLSVSRIDQMPEMPTNFQMRDWRQTALNFDQEAFDLNAKGQYLPLVWLDDSRTNFPELSFGLPAYVGQPAKPGGEEGITCMGAVLGATLVGVDKSKGTHDWVHMCDQFYNKANGEDIFMDGYTRTSGGSYWYEVFPNMVYDGLAYYYPDVPGTSALMHASADRWCDATLQMKDASGKPDFNHLAFNLKTRQFTEAKPGEVHKEPDAAAGLSYLMVLAYARYHDPKFLKAADAGQAFLTNFGKNPLYEVMMPYGAYAAARLNAEYGRDYDVQRLVGYTFNTSDIRYRWGTVIGSWNGYGVDGLAGSTLDFDGYAFAFETFNEAGAMVPMVRYDQRFARAVGKWALNAASASRLFYNNVLPPQNQTGAAWKGDPLHAIAYEGLRKHYPDPAGVTRSPYVCGDPTRSNPMWAPTDYCVYGGAYVGYFGGTIARTNDPAVLRLDCLKMDLFRQKAYPTYLYYNPRAQSTRINVAVGAKPSSLYDTVTHQFVKSGVTGTTAVTIHAGSAMVLVTTPAGGRPALNGHKLTVNGVVVDFRAGRMQQRSVR